MKVIIKFFKDLFFEPGKNKWSLGRLTFTALISVMAYKYGVMETIQDLPSNWMVLLMFLFGAGKYSTYLHSKIDGKEGE